MKLTSQSLSEITDVTNADLDRVFGGELFGKYALLGDPDGDFIEVGFKGSFPDWAFDYPPGTWERDQAEEWKAFKERTGSERWTMDYFDEAAGDQFEAVGDLTLAEVWRAFSEYLRGNDDWKSRHRWVKLKSCGPSGTEGNDA